MPANLENSAVVTGLENVSFHSNPQKGQCQRMVKLPHSCTHFTCWQSKAKNSPSQASTACKLRTPRCSRWIQKRQRSQRSNCQHPLDYLKKKKKKTTRKFQENIYFCFIDYTKVFDCVDHYKLWKILQEMGIPDCFTCLLRNLHADQEAIVRIGH